MKYGLMNWNGGKNSALAYQKIKEKKSKIVSLVTNVNMPSNETPFHRIPFHMIELQAMQMGIPIQPIYHSEEIDNRTYESNWEMGLEDFETLNLDFIAEGDINQIEIINYKKYLHEKLGYQSLFVIEGHDTYATTKLLFQSGFKAKIIAVDANKLSKDWIGQEFDEAFIAQLPPELDPAGEDGAFYTYVYDGPIFKRAIHVDFGKIYLYEIDGVYNVTQWNVKMRGI